MKRYVLSVLAAVLCIGMTGCGGKTDNHQAQNSEQCSLSDSKAETPWSSQPVLDEPSEKETESTVLQTMEIVDKDGKHIGQIPVGSGVTLTSKGIFYSTVKTDLTDSDTIAAGMEGAKEEVVYHLYDPQKNESVSFGSVPGQDYEAGYVRTELNGNLYTLVTTGNAMDSVPDPLLLLEFDLTAHTLHSYQISDNGFPYTAMTAVGGKLLILNHDQTDTLHDKVYAFDPVGKEIKEVMQFELADNAGESIRGMNSDGKNLYLLRLRFTREGQVGLFVDTYDLDYHKLAEKEISSMLREAVGKELAAEDIENEMKQPISRFMVLEGEYVYYENFSTTRLLGNINNGKLLPETEGLGDMFLAAGGSGEPFFYCIFGGGRNENAVFEWKNGTLEKTVFHGDDDRYYITAASCSPDGKRLIQAEYVNPENRSDTLPAKLYYF